jgi:hypothetical protein
VSDLPSARAFLLTQAAAIAFSFVHAVMDWYVGLFGTDRAVMSVTAAGLLGLEGLLYAGWAVALALRADSAWMAVVFALTLGWAFLANGGSIFFCLPPCSALPPWGDVAHLGVLIAGAWASWLAWRELRRDRSAFDRRPLVAAIALLLVVNVLSSTLAAEFMASQRQ